MGLCQGYSLSACCYRRQPIFVLFIGLDNSGKTSIVRWFTSMSTTKTMMKKSSFFDCRDCRPQTSENELGDVTDGVVPTIGFNVSRIELIDERCPIIAFDMSGQVWSAIVYSITYMYKGKDLHFSYGLYLEPSLNICSERTMYSNRP